MKVNALEKTEDQDSSIVVERQTGDFITIKKVKRGTEYEIDFFVFKPEDLEELKRLQAKIYESKEVNRGLIARFRRLMMPITDPM
jgi:hypothetical protein